jgi:hypothetical protein
MQTGVSNMVAHGLAANVSLSGAVNVNGTSVPFTGTGTYTLAPGVSAMFNGAAALSQTETIAGTITAAGQSQPFPSTSVTDYYQTSTSSFLGENDGSEYDVAETPFEYPTTISGASSGTLGTVLRYTDSTQSVSLGTVQVTYQTMAPVDPGSPLGIVLTSKIYDTQNTLLETDTTHYNMTTGNVISFVSASVQNPTEGNLTVTAQ